MDKRRRYKILGVVILVVGALLVTLGLFVHSGEANEAFSSMESGTRFLILILYVIGAAACSAGSLMVLHGFREEYERGTKNSDNAGEL